MTGAVWDNCSFTFIPDEAQVAGEIGDKRDQVPGRVSDHDGIVNATVENDAGNVNDAFASGSIQGNAPGGGPPGSWFNVFKAGSQHLEIWDGDCS